MSHCWIIISGVAFSALHIKRVGNSQIILVTMKLDGVNELGKIREYCVTARA